uniref:Uncharacterized protein n=1 Tax=uncultured bacterium contig00103 TaxID=1181570 RepID=A0A806JZ66_9BACT|nr:hypothetical protein [uncultured bacterium contig00103]
MVPTRLYCAVLKGISANCAKALAHKKIKINGILRYIGNGNIVK